MTTEASIIAFGTSVYDQYDNEWKLTLREGAEIEEVKKILEIIALMPDLCNAYGLKLGNNIFIPKT